jgi:argininosuccinate lyase
LAETEGVGLAELTVDQLQGVEPRITEDVFDVLSTSASVASRSSFGGTAPENVLAAIAAAKDRFGL